MIAASLIGVSITRCSPKRGSSPLVMPNTPPAASRWPEVPPAPPDTSSPMMSTRSSLSISRCSASLMASRNVFLGMARTHLIAVVYVGEEVFRPRTGRLTGSGNGGLDQLQHLCIDLIEHVQLQLAGLFHALAELEQAVFVLAVAAHLILVAVVLRVTLEVAEVADGFAVDGRRTATVARQLQRLGHGLVDREEVEAVGQEYRNAEALDALDDVVTTDAVGRAGVFAVAVVLEHEHLGHLQHHGHVHRLEHGALVGGAVTGKGQRHIALAVQLAGDGRTDRDRLTGTDDAVGTEHALGNVGNVHGAALAAIESFTAAEDLLHHRRHVAALGDAVAVTTVGTDDVVALGQVLAGTDGDRFLTAVQVSESGNGAGRILDMQAFLEFTDGFHLAVGPDQGLPGQSAGLGCSARGAFSCSGTHVSTPREHGFILGIQ